jgi:hypothetical protein
VVVFEVDLAAKDLLQLIRRDQRSGVRLFEETDLFCVSGGFGKRSASLFGVFLLERPNMQWAVGRLRTFSFVTGSTNGDTSCFIKVRSVRPLASCRSHVSGGDARSHFVEGKEDLRDVDADGLAQSFAVISLQDLEPGGSGRRAEKKE